MSNNKMYRDMFDTLADKPLTLIEFLEKMVKDCEKRDQHWNAEHHRHLIKILSPFNEAEQRDRLEQMVVDLTARMEAEGTSGVDHGVLWSMRGNAEQALRFMDGEINLK